MKPRRLFVMITGQYRKFLDCWQNMIDTIILPSQNAGLDVYLCFGLDAIYQSPGCLWDQPKPTFPLYTKDVCSEDHVLLEWIRHLTEPYFKMAVLSLEHYKETKQLEIGWFDYLVHRSGSCIEYAQIARLYDMVCSRYDISTDDLLLRTRCDVILSHPIQLSVLPSIGQSSQHVFHSLFPSVHVFEDSEKEPKGREVSFFPPKPVQDRWVVTLRKNLVYLMPMTCGRFLKQVAMRYGDWDNQKENDYWFNAESQFRGCLRSHDFTIWEYSQKKDECFDRNTMSPQDFPLYAILR